MQSPITSSPASSTPARQRRCSPDAARRGGRLATQATTPASDVPFLDRTDAAPGSNVSGRRRRTPAATPGPPKARRRSLTSSGVATSWPRVPLMALRLGRTRFAWRDGWCGGVVRRRCGRHRSTGAVDGGRAAGRWRGVGVGRRAARGGGAARRARADR